MMTKKNPLYLQIYKEIKENIKCGTLPAGTKLLSKRKLAAKLSVSTSTVDTAYAQLISEGFVESKAKSGFYVANIGKLFLQPLPANQAKPPIEKKTEACLVNFNPSGVDTAFFPYTVWRKMIRSALSVSTDILLSPSPAQGELYLRDALCPYLYISRGVICQPEQIIVGAGTDNLLHILSYILDNRCAIAMEDPVYNESFSFFKRMGHTVISIPTDKQGVQVEPLHNLEHAALYVTPSHQFPLGLSMPISRRISLLNWAYKKKERYIIEDDYDSEFRYQNKPLPSLKSTDENHRVIYLGSFSRSVAPSLRISYMVLPQKLLEIYHGKYKAFSCACSKLEQLALAEFIQKGHYETHINKMRKLYREKRDLLVESLQTNFQHTIEILGENAGHHILIHQMLGLSELEMCAKAKEQGACVYPLSPYFIGEMPKQYQNTIIAGYATLSDEKILHGVQLLRKAWL